jgi:hypothetical protein
MDFISGFLVGGRLISLALIFEQTYIVLVLFNRIIEKAVKGPHGSI